MLGNIPRPGRDFAGLCRYLLGGPGGSESTTHRVAWTLTRNLTTEDIKLAAKIMTATAECSVRVQRPTYHAIVSWKSDEQPTRDQMEVVVATTLADLGLQDHQAVVVAHGDTRNPHFHIVANRIHPDTGVAWSTKHDYRRMEQSVFRQAQAHGFHAVPGRHNQPSPLRLLPRVRSRGAMMLARKTANAAKPWTRAQVKAVSPRVKAILAEATAWDHVAKRLLALGGRIEAKGQGLIIRDDKNAGYLKLSSLGPDVRRAALEQRFAETFTEFVARTNALQSEPAVPPPSPAFTAEADTEPKP